jgi:RNA polymerase sigma-70 factor (ECF subfamily)
MAETDLVSHAKLGSPMAFSELYTRTYQSVLNYISLWLKQWDSEDIAQEAFLRAQQYLSGFRGDSSFATWVRSIAEQLVIQHRRNTPEFVPLDENILPVQEPEDVLQSLQKQKILSWLETFVKTLPQTQREAFELRIQKGLSYEAISQKTGKNVQTLWKTCQRVRNKWRKYYTALQKKTELPKNSR